MISHIKGTILAKGKETVIVETVSGVGYTLFLPVLQVIALSVGGEVAYFTYMKVSESDMQLFGFETIPQKEFFELLLSVKGVGPKAALRILSLGTLDEIQGAIARSDVKYLTAVQGMGKKTAERLVVELKSKIAPKGIAENVSTSENLGEVMDALVNLGYTAVDVREVIKQLDGENSTEVLLKQSLQLLSNSK